MKWIDPEVELVVCGSATTLQETFPEWDRKVLEYTYEKADYLSLHRYYENEGNDFDFLASFVDMDRFINTIAGTADYVKALKRSDKTMYLSFDEWNVWYQHNQKEHDWMEAPEILEDRYSLLDALVFSGMGMTLINHADRVKIACLAQLVNVIAPIFTEKNGRVMKQTIFYPFQYLSTYGRGMALKPVVVAPTAESRYGETPLLHSSVVFDEEKKQVNVFCLNLSDDEMELDLDMRSFGKLSMIEHLELSGPDLNAVNTFDQPDTVTMKAVENLSGSFEACKMVLPKYSWHVLRFQCEE